MLKTKTLDVELVSRFELEEIKRLRAELEAERAEVDRRARALREREESVIARVEAGVPVDGQATVLVRRRQNISWLTVVKRELGADAVVQVKNAWPVAFYKDLQLG
jgi:hypothetical protein